VSTGPSSVASALRVRGQRPEAELTEREHHLQRHHHPGEGADQEHDRQAAEPDVLGGLEVVRHPVRPARHHDIARRSAVLPNVDELDRGRERVAHADADRAAELAVEAGGGIGTGADLSGGTGADAALITRPAGADVDPGARA
jgi:hypothetical protein